MRQKHYLVAQFELYLILEHHMIYKNVIAVYSTMRSINLFSLPYHSCSICYLIFSATYLLSISNFNTRRQKALLIFLKVSRQFSPLFFSFAILPVAKDMKQPWMAPMSYSCPNYVQLCIRQIGIDDCNNSIALI